MKKGRTKNRRKKTSDLFLGLRSTTFLGFFFGASCVILSIFSAGHAELFINLPSLLIIVGGTVATVVMAFPLSKLKSFFSICKIAFVKRDVDFMAEIDKLVELSERARKEGKLQLEDEVSAMDDDFLQNGLMMVIDGYEYETIQTLMQNALVLENRRHRKSAAMIGMVGSAAPSLGLLGTYIGLIPMLQSLEEPTKLGPLMAIELVSSFYGSFIAYIMFVPLSKRLLAINEEELMRKELLLEGILAISENINPRQVKERLLAFLTSSEAAKARRKDSRYNIHLVKNDPEKAPVGSE